MTITEQNKYLVKAFVRVLRDMKVSPEGAQMITSTLQNKQQMDSLVAYIKCNNNATESELIDKAIEISQR